jgi:hypothetical protein
MRRRIAARRLAASIGALIALVAPDARGDPHRISWPHESTLAATMRNGVERVRVAQGVGIAGVPWPGRVARVEIPPDARVVGATIAVRREAPLGHPGDALLVPSPGVAPTGPPSEGGGYRYWILPEGDLRGHRIAHVLIVPFREVDGGVRYLESFDLEVAVETGFPRAAARRASHPRTEAADARALRGLLDADPLPIAAETAAPAVTIPPELGPETTEYVIITTSELAPALQEIADLKTREGQPAKITTTEWILDHYVGVDLAARIRLYLRDLYLYQGLRYALLAGDAELVPTRLATGRYQFSEGKLLSAEYYFACLDGDWNGDGDEEFGEAPMEGQGIAGDEVDLLPEIAVSRVPCGSPEEAEAFVQKWKSYTGYDGASFHSDYQRKYLALAEVLFPDDWDPNDPPEDIILDGADICEETLTHVPGSILRTKLYEYFENPDVPDALPELRDSVIAHINRGYHWIDHVGHGHRNNMSVGNGILLNPDADGFTNTNRYSVLYAINCASGAFFYDSIVEHLLLNPLGGCIGACASTDLDYPTVSEDFKFEFFRLVFEAGVTRLGDAFHEASALYAPVAAIGENAYRWTIMTLLAFGDPSLELWLGPPRTLVLDFDGDVPLGAGNFTVSVAHDLGQPAAGATVCLWKEDGYGVAVADSEGVAVVEFLPETEGRFLITAAKNTCRAAVDSSLVVAAAGAALRVVGTAVHDGDGAGGEGNGDGRADAGESIVLDVSIRNDGAATATGVETIAHLPGPFVAVADSAETGPDVEPDSTRTLALAFAFDVAAGLPDSLRHVVVPALIELRSDQGEWMQPWPLSLSQRLLELVDLDWTIGGDDGDGILETGETAEIHVTLGNYGEGTARDVVLVGSVSGNFVMNNDTAVFGDIGPGGEVQAGPISVLSTGGNAMQLRVQATVSDLHGSPLLSRTIDVLDPPAPNNIVVASTEHSITLSWPRPAATDVRGYHLFRSGDAAGPYEPLTPDAVVGGSFFTDENLPALTSFFYRASTVDSSGNKSAMSDSVEARTSPPLLEGWPVELPSGEAKGSPTFFDLDDDGAMEIVLGWNYPIVVRANGGDFVDGDSTAYTLGIFSTIGGGESMFWNSPAVADLDADSLDEIVFCAWQTTTGPAEMYVLDETGAVEPGWPREIGNQPWSTAAVGDVDGDGRLEIFTSSGASTGAYRGVLFGFHHDGTEIIDGDANPATHGIFYKSSSAQARYMYGSPALGDLDDDGNDEIVFLENTVQAFPSRSTLYAFDGNGTVLPGFPYADPTLQGSTSSPALADLDDDGRLEIVAVAQNRIVVLNDDGSVVPGWPQTLPGVDDSETTIRDFLSSPAVADVNRDGRLDIALGWLSGLLYLWTGENGAPHAGFPADLTGDGTPFDQYIRSPVIGNLDADPEREIVVSSGAARVYAVNADGSQAPGFPIQLEGVTHGSVAIWDLDGDGNVNMVVQTDAPIVRAYDLFDAPFAIEDQSWPMFRHDQRKTGNRRTPVTIGVDSGPGTGAASDAPRVFAAHPNPFSPRVSLRFITPAGGEHVRIRVFEVSGREVRTLADGRFPQGSYRIAWDGRDAAGRPLAPGVYFVRTDVGPASSVQKVTMLR